MTLFISYLASFLTGPTPFLFYLRIAIGLLLFRALIDLYLEFYRVEGRTKLYVVLILSQRYLGLALSVFFALYVFKGLTGLFIGTLVAEGSLAIGFLIFLVSKKKVTRVMFDLSIIRSLLEYGMPLVIASASVFIMNLGDRYVIGYYMKMEDVANYTIAYQLAHFSLTLLFLPGKNAFHPALFSLFEREGITSAANLITTSMRYMVFFTMPLIFGLSYLGHDLISIMATKSYASSAQLLPLLLVGFVAYGFYEVFMGSVFRLLNKTKTMGLITGAGAVGNMALNVLLIPYWGLWGASAATLITYFSLALYTYLLARRQMAISMSLIAILKAMACSVGMLLVLMAIGMPFQWPVVNLLVKVIVGAVVYGGLLIAVDGECKQVVQSYLYSRKREVIS